MFSFFVIFCNIDDEMNYFAGTDLSAPREKDGWMVISFVIPAYNEAKGIGRCLASLDEAIEAVSAMPEHEIIVVDNNSSDQTAAIARETGARVVFEGENQIARARNCGAQAAQGDWLVFLDADSWIGPELLEDLLKEINAGKTGAGGATICFPSDAGWSMRTALWGWNLISRMLKWAAGSFIFCRKDLFQAIGGFDENFFAGEEVDLSRRLKRICRKKRLRFRILAKHPLLTSARKEELYSTWELFGFAFRFLILPKRTLKRRKDCSIWYDGKR
ncbi:MAG: glycosyltransferase [Candidatus Sumerlaeia bacterium]